MAVFRPVAVPGCPVIAPGGRGSTGPGFVLPGRRVVSCWSAGGVSLQAGDRGGQLAGLGAGRGQAQPQAAAAMARSVRIFPGSCTARGARHRARAPDRPSPRPVTRAASASSSTPAWDTSPVPSADTVILARRRHSLDVQSVAGLLVGRYSPQQLRTQLLIHKDRLSRTGVNGSPPPGGGAGGGRAGL